MIVLFPNPKVTMSALLPPSKMLFPSPSAIRSQRPMEAPSVVPTPRHNLEVSIVEEKSGSTPVDLDHRITASRSGPVVDDIDGPFGVNGLVKPVAAEDLHLHAEWQVRVREIRELEERIGEHIESCADGQQVRGRHPEGRVSS